MFPASPLRAHLRQALDLTVGFLTLGEYGLRDEGEPRSGQIGGSEGVIAQAGGSSWRGSVAETAIPLSDGLATVAAQVGGPGAGAPARASAAAGVAPATAAGHRRLPARSTGAAGRSGDRRSLSRAVRPAGRPCLGGRRGGAAPSAQPCLTTRT